MKWHGARHPFIVKVSRAKHHSCCHHGKLLQHHSTKQATLFNLEICTSAVLHELNGLLDFTGTNKRWRLQTTLNTALTRFHAH